MERLVATWRETGLIDEHTRFERVQLAGAPAALLDVPSRPARLLTLGCWLCLGADGVVRVTTADRPPQPERVQAVQHRGSACLDEMDVLVAEWLTKQLVDDRTTLTRTDYQGQPAAVLLDSRRRGQLLVPGAWLVRRLDGHLYVLSAERFAAEFASIEPATASPGRARTHRRDL
jgi:hypothetical protein